ncbi:MAG: hypothetical protein HYY96_08175 [Candidatus Tectomicrobia bacterium]|nr:hypothetical protein [Candidatus Tectomicrobia bacterium]
MRTMMNGAEAMAEAAKLSGVKVTAVFPITPQTEVAELLCNTPGITTLRGNSEYNVMALTQGAAWGGARVFTVTAGQGLVLMSELMWEVAGNRLPIVMGVFSRSLKGPTWSLGSQQNDALMMRDTGWLQFYCESAQEILDYILIAYKLCEQVSMPAMVVGDGFYLSHTTEPIDLPEPEQVARFLLPEPPQKVLPIGLGATDFASKRPPVDYYHFYEELNDEVRNLPEGPLPHVFEEFARLFGRERGLVETHNCDRARTVFVTSGITSGTVRAYINEHPESCAAVGLIKLLGLRPFPERELLAAIGPQVENLVVIDRNVSVGRGGIWAQEIAATLFNRPGPRPTLFNYIVGIGGENVDQQVIERIHKDIISGNAETVPRFIH